jgi:phosphoglycolate phosphatase
MIEAVIFDFDGTLAELTLNFTYLRREVEKIAERYVGAAAVRQLESLYIIEMIDEVNRMVGEEGLAFSEEAFMRLSSLEIEAASGKAVYPYTREVLRVLREKGVKIGIITRNCMAALAKVFPDMEAYVDAVRTREHVREVKPKPGHMEAVLRALDVAGSGALLVGDHPMDILAGEAAGATTVGVLTGRTTRAEFERVGAGYVMDDIRSVVSLVDRNPRQ